MESTKQAIFILGEQEYGLDIMDVKTIEKVIAINPVSNSPRNMKGLINLRGDMIPVYSLRRKFGLEDIEPNDDTRFIITTSNEILMAYEVDKMAEIVTAETEQMSEVPTIVKTKDTSYMKHVINMNERLIILLDQDGILTEEEQDKIKKIIRNQKSK